jgi:peptidoglycan/xylan/chitin deacetylase (PgdA/CDA1 family)
MTLAALKRTALSVLVVPGAAKVFRPLMRDRATVFMLHRFARPGFQEGGHSIDALRSTLAWLRRKRYDLLSLGELVEGLERGVAPSRAVVFTIDDGYAEQAALAAPVFAEFDCPATTFLTTGFIDGTLWLWWDRVEYVFANTKRHEVSLEIGDETVAYRWSNDAERQAAHSDLHHRCKRMPNDVKHATIVELADALEVDLPSRAPARYAPMTWDDARRAERGGMTFGPHTVTHPILSRTSDECLASEIGESWQRVKDELADPVPVFCYPNGKGDDYGPREMAVLERLKLRAAVLSTPGYASPDAFRRSPTSRYEIPRYSLPMRLPLVIQVVAGVERLKGMWRGDAV